MAAQTAGDRPPSIQEITAASNAERAERRPHLGRPSEASMIPGILAIVIALASVVALWMIS